MQAENLTGVRVGDELLLIDSYGRPPKPTPVRVHKVGRTLVHVLRNPDRPELGTDAYRIEDGVAHDGYGHSQVVTRAHWEQECRRSALEAALRERGVETWRKGPKPVPVLERLLAVLEDAEG